jgi:lysophospholipase L1-like esterase
MPMGDSITAGAQVPGGYRAPLSDRITSQGWIVDFVGSQRQPGDTSADPDHWGRSGWGITDTDAVLNGRRCVSLQANEGPRGARRPGLWDDLQAAISPRSFSNSGGVDNLLLMVGTNDVVHQVVERRNGARPAGDRGNNGRGEQQNRIGEATEVNDWIRQRSSGLHPDAEGYRRMADTWWEGIQKALV